MLKDTGNIEATLAIMTSRRQHVASLLDQELTDHEQSQADDFIAWKQTFPLQATDV